MPILHRKSYWGPDKTVPVNERVLYQGYDVIDDHDLFGWLDGHIYLRNHSSHASRGAVVVDKKGHIYVNVNSGLSAAEWTYAIAHALLHLAFGHFDDDKIPKDEKGAFDVSLWNKACDIYIARFLADVKFGKPICQDPALFHSIKLNDEKKIYEYLMNSPGCDSNNYGTNHGQDDMIGLSHPIVYKTGERNDFVDAFAEALRSSVSTAVHLACGRNRKTEETVVTKAANWFLTHYPLLGGVASAFKIIEDVETCHAYEIHIAAVDISAAEIYVNPAANLSEEEWKFVLAHEYLHAGLSHHKRCLGRDSYLWNVACDYVINEWLIDMNIGKMPEDGLLYDRELKGYSAEAIYDLIMKEIRKYKKLATFRGFGHGDIMKNPVKGFGSEITAQGISLDEFFRNALKEGYDFHHVNERGYLPAGLIEEIRALATPPIPWKVELGKWFDYQFPPLEKHRSYARPSRRQGSTPDIPRPRYVMMEEELENRTFGVVVDTSGSMSNRLIGLALGAIASYAISKDVPFVRVVFCDAAAYDVGYMTPEDIASRVKVTGRGGTVLQPGITLLEKEENFPKDAPILIITDGGIEDKLVVKRKHAYLLPKGNKLPFNPKGEVFYFKERGDF